MKYLVIKKIVNGVEVYQMVDYPLIMSVGLTKESALNVLHQKFIELINKVDE